MGLKKMIRNLIPQPWEKILSEERALSEYVDMVYKNVGNHKLQTAEMKKCRIKRVRLLVSENYPTSHSRDFWNSFDAMALTIEEREYWNKINRKIQNYKVSCG